MKHHFYKNWLKFSFKPNRLIFEKPLESQESVDEDDDVFVELELQEEEESAAQSLTDTPQQESKPDEQTAQILTDDQQGAAPTMDELSTTDTVQSAVEKKEDAKQINEEFKSNAKNYYEGLDNPELSPEEQQAKVRELESQSEFSIRAGYAITEEGKEEEKYSKYSELFVDKEIDPETGQEMLRVKNLQSDHMYMSVGAATVLPPSVQIATICTNGVCRTGHREFRNVEGYYDQSGYIIINQNSTIYPGGKRVNENETRFISEDSEQYNLEIESIKTNFKNIKTRAEANDYHNYYGESGDKVQRYYSLESLRNVKEEDLVEQSAIEKENILKAQKDLGIVEQVLISRRIASSDDNIVNGGKALMNNGEKIKRAIGWTAEMDTAFDKSLITINSESEKAVQGEDTTITILDGLQFVVTKNEAGELIYKDPVNNNYEIPDLNKFIAKKIISKYTLEKTQTVSLINALNGRETFTILNRTYRFTAYENSYLADYQEIATFYNMINNDPQGLIDKLDEVQENPNAIIPNQDAVNALVETYYGDSLSVEEAYRAAEQIGFDGFWNPNAVFDKYGRPVSKNKQYLGRYLDKIAEGDYEGLKDKNDDGLGDVNLNIYEFQNEIGITDSNGDPKNLQCANYVKRMLGLKHLGGTTGKVFIALLAEHLKRSNGKDTGIMMGDMSKFIPGSIVMFGGGYFNSKHTKGYGFGSYGHIGLVAGQESYMGEPVCIIYHHTHKGAEASFKFCNEGSSARGLMDDAIDDIKDDIKGMSKAQIEQHLGSHTDTRIKALLPFSQYIAYRSNFPDRLVVKKDKSWRHPPPDNEYGIAFACRTDNL
ncbi:hypothetical protein ACFL21_02755 [Patescibacteria group bacterium]